MRLTATLLTVALVVFAALASGCSSNDTSGPPAGSFYGLYGEATGAFRGPSR